MYRASSSHETRSSPPQQSGCWTDPWVRKKTGRHGQVNTCICRLTGPTEFQKCNHCNRRNLPPLLPRHTITYTHGRTQTNTLNGLTDTPTLSHEMKKHLVKHKLSIQQPLLAAANSCCWSTPDLCKMIRVYRFSVHEPKLKGKKRLFVFLNCDFA